jgi:hypothetical protein
MHCFELLLDERLPLFSLARQVGRQIRHQLGPKVYALTPRIAVRLPKLLPAFISALNRAASASLTA